MKERRRDDFGVRKCTLVHTVHKLSPLLTETLEPQVGYSHLSHGRVRCHGIEVAHHHGVVGHRGGRLQERFAAKLNPMQIQSCTVLLPRTPLPSYLLDSGRGAHVGHFVRRSGLLSLQEWGRGLLTNRDATSRGLRRLHLLGKLVRVAVGQIAQRLGRDELARLRKQQKRRNNLGGHAADVRRSRFLTSYAFASALISLLRRPPA